MKKDKKWIKRGLAFLMSALICFHVGAVPVLANETTSNTVNEALLSQFEKDTFLQNVLGKSVSELFIARKSDEWSEFCQQVTAWEVEKYLNQI